MTLVTTEQMMDIIQGLRQNQASMAYQMMGPEQNDEVNYILNEIEDELGVNYLTLEDSVIEKTVIWLLNEQTTRKISQRIATHSGKASPPTQRTD